MKITIDTDKKYIIVPDKPWGFVWKSLLLTPKPAKRYKKRGNSHRRGLFPLCMWGMGFRFGFAAGFPEWLPRPNFPEN